MGVAGWLFLVDSTEGVNGAVVPLTVIVGSFRVVFLQVELG